MDTVVGCCRNWRRMIGNAGWERLGFRGWLVGQTHLDSVMIATGGSDRQTMACRAHLYARN